MTNLKRRKPFKYKANKVVKVPKTARKEMTPIQRAFVAGAVIASRDGYASANALSQGAKWYVITYHLIVSAGSYAYTRVHCSIGGTSYLTSMVHPNISLPVE
jgi:hypothetical protein